ncbi:MAG: hypothetical protein R3E89_17355 [Thiolinea sp.]
MPGDRSFHINIGYLAGGFSDRDDCRHFGVEWWLPAGTVYGVLAQHAHAYCACHGCHSDSDRWCGICVRKYLRLGASPDYTLLGLLVLGGVAGAVIGPVINRLARERWLQATLGLIVTGIGLRYVLS